MLSHSTEHMKFLKYFQASGSSKEIIVYSQSQSFTGIPEQAFNREDWNAKANVISEMGDDLTPPDARPKAGDIPTQSDIPVYSQSESFTGFPEQAFSREDWNAKANAISEMGDDLTPSDARPKAGDIPTQSGIPVDCFNPEAWTEISKVIQDLAEDPTQKKLRAESGEKSTVAAQQNVTKTQKEQVCVCNYIVSHSFTFSVILLVHMHFMSFYFISLVADYNGAF